MRRFFLAEPLMPNMIIQGEDAYHISTVLRLRVSDTILVVAPDRQVAVAELTEIKANEVAISLREMITEEHEPPVQVYLAQGLPKSDKMDYIVQKAVELGASKIIPIAAERSVVKYEGAKREQRRERWQKIAGEAAKQCGRTVVPIVEPIQQLAEIFAKIDGNAAVVMLYEGQAVQGIKSFLINNQCAAYLLLIGPEGGFSPAEVSLCQAYGGHIITMGPRILRTETAALAALSVVMYEQGDLGGEQ